MLPRWGEERWGKKKIGRRRGGRKRNKEEVERAGRAVGSG